MHIYFLFVHLFICLFIYVIIYLFIFSSICIDIVFIPASKHCSPSGVYTCVCHMWVLSMHEFSRGIGATLLDMPKQVQTGIAAIPASFMEVRRTCRTHTFCIFLQGPAQFVKTLFRAAFLPVDLGVSSTYLVCLNNRRVRCHPRRCPFSLDIPCFPASPSQG